MKLCDFTKECMTLLRPLFKFSHIQAVDQSKRTSTCRLHENTQLCWTEFKCLFNTYPANVENMVSS